MHDVAIVGAGLCGLALARMLEEAGQSVVLVEARDRLGGRILVGRDEATGLSVDLGPTWFWPDRQPLLRKLLEDHEIRSFPQNDEGVNLSLADPEKGPEASGSASIHGGAHRIDGGMARLVEALAAPLDKTEIRLKTRVAALSDAGDHVLLSCVWEGIENQVAARRCVLALPPRLVASLTFGPELDVAVVSALADVQTWMATSAKAAVACGAPAWRVAGHSGSAFATHGQAVLAECWDACDADGNRAGLAGFLALTPEQRRDFATGLPMLIASQFAQLYGHDIAMGDPLFKDWADDPLTCAPADRADAPAQHPHVADSLLRMGQWGDRLFFAGAETSARDPGYLEGALDAADRTARQIVQALEQERLLAEPVNAQSAGGFARWVEGKKVPAFADYRRTMAHALMRQDREQLTQRALLRAVEAVLDEALTVLDTLPFDAREAGIDKGRSSLLPLVQAPFKPFFDDLLDEAFAFNASSCALSNFPDEHKPPRDYKNAILRDIAAAWVEFSQDANALLIRRAHGLAPAGEA
jgi:monoamine oxidase